MAPSKTSSYLNYLPAIFHEDPFLGEFLLGFEHVLTGLEDPNSGSKQGLEATIANISKLFNPGEIATFFSPDGSPLTKQDQDTLQHFLQWLAGWTALSLRADWDTGQQQRFLAQVVPLYRRRGTKENLAELVRIYTGLLPQIDEAPDIPFQIGRNSTVNATITPNTPQLGGGAAHYFRITAYMGSSPSADLNRQREIIRSLVDLQKPAHTYYDLEIRTDTMQIGKRSTVGVDTLLGSIPNP